MRSTKRALLTRLAATTIAVVIVALPVATLAQGTSDEEAVLWEAHLASIRNAEEAASAADAAIVAAWLASEAAAGAEVGAPDDVVVLNLDRMVEDGPTPADAVALFDAFGWPAGISPGKLLEEVHDVDAVRSNTKTKPVLLVHGRDNYDMGGYASMVTYLKSTYGFSTVYRVGYYGGECNVEYRAEHHGDHNKHYGGSGEHSSKTGCNGVAGAQVHDLGTDIMHIAYHLAWMIYDHFSAGGTVVDYVGHSMGGLLIRYDLAKDGTTDFPSTLSVEDVVTMGTPHGGLSSWCVFSPWADVRQMCSSNSWIQWMKTNAQNPQSNGWPTDWTLMASDGTCDGWVTENQALDMNGVHKVSYRVPCYSHSQYYGDTSGVEDADVDYQDPPSTTWNYWTNAPHSVRWASHGLYYGTW